MIPETSQGPNVISRCKQECMMTAALKGLKMFYLMQGFIFYIVVTGEGGGGLLQAVN